MSKSDAKRTRKPPRVANKKARHDYNVLEVVECGIELVGTEVKSLRAGQAKIDEAYARIRDGEVFLVGANIAPYPHAGEQMQHDPTRDRKLLLKKRQIKQLESQVRQKGKTLIPLEMYFNGSWAKCRIAVAEGKKQYDKRRAIKARQQQRDIDREIGRRGPR